MGIKGSQLPGGKSLKRHIFRACLCQKMYRVEAVVLFPIKIDMIFVSV